MDNCYVGANVTLTGLNAAAFRAYAKNAPGGSITNCYSLATTNATAQYGLIGLFWDSADSLVLSNCYNANGPVSTHGANGQATDIEIQAKQILRIKATLNEILAQNTGKPLEIIEKDTDRDNYMTAQEALEYGLIDKILTHRP